MKTLSEPELRAELVSYYKRIAELGLNELSSGNLSVRYEDGMLISANGASADSISTQSVVKTQLDGRYQGDQRPSSEWRMHAAIYKQHSEARAIVHTHSDYCVAVSSHVQALPGFHYLIGVFGGDDVPCVRYSTFGTQTLADDAALALTERTACLLGNHGMIARGPNLKRAVNTAHRLEIMCRQYILSKQLGEPRRLTAAEWKEFFGRDKATLYVQNS